MNYEFSKEFGAIPKYNPGEAIFSDALGPFPVDESGNQFIIAMVSAGDHWVNLYPVPSLDAKCTADCLMREFGVTGCPTIFWSDQGSNYTSKVIREFCKYFEVNQVFSLPYRPEANGIAERSHRETLKHLRAIVMSKQVLKYWSTYLPMVQWIINTSYIHSIGSTAMKLRFGDSREISRGFTIDLFNSKSDMSDASTYIQNLNTQLYHVLKASTDYQDNLNHTYSTNFKGFEVGNYVLVKYPNRPPTKISPLFRGPMVILENLGNNGYLCKDIISGTEIQVANNRLKAFRMPPYDVDLEGLAAADHDEFVVEEILDFRGNPKRKTTGEFLLKWKGYDDSENTWEPWKTVKELGALDSFLNNRPELRKFFQ